MEVKVDKGDLIVDGVRIQKNLRTRCEVWSRPVGYLRPIQHWNEGKKQEYRERKEYRVSNVENKN